MVLFVFLVILCIFRIFKFCFTQAQHKEAHAPTKYMCIYTPAYIAFFLLVASILKSLRLFAESSLCLPQPRHHTFNGPSVVRPLLGPSEHALCCQRVLAESVGVFQATEPDT